MVATIFGVALPFFAVLACGMLAGRLKLLDTAGLMGLNAFVFWFALPALLFLKVATTPLARLTDPDLYIVYEGSCLILYALVFGIARWVAKLDTPHSAICAFAAAWGNVGYMGVPLLVAAYGEGQALPAVVAVVLDSIILQGLTILILESSLGARGGLWAVGRSVVLNPLIAAVAAGAVVAAIGLALPLPVTGFLQLLGQAAGPGALFALGATLRGFGGGINLRLVGWITGAKLLLLPAIALVMLRFLPLPPDLVVPTLITTALPAAASVFVIAQRYGVMEGPVAAVVFISHLAGIITLTLLLAFLGA